VNTLSFFLAIITKVILVHSGFYAWAQILLGNRIRVVLCFPFL
jgi:uncharacterized protein YPO0396